MKRIGYLKLQMVTYYRRYGTAEGWVVKADIRTMRTVPGGGGASEEHWHRASAPETAAIMRNSFFTFMILQQKKRARQSGERRLTRKRS